MTRKAKVFYCDQLAGYLLINSNLINPADKEDVALLLNGRKRNISRNDFWMLSQVLGIRETVFNRILKKYTQSHHKFFLQFAPRCLNFNP